MPKFTLMKSTFGQTLRKFRLASGIGLRELARQIHKSPGYLSDVELDNVAPPSEEVLINIASALQVDKKELLMAARKMDPELSSYVAQAPEAADFLRMAKEKGFDSEDWERLSQLAKLAKLGKEDKERK